MAVTTKGRGGGVDGHGLPPGYPSRPGDPTPPGQDRPAAPMRTAPLPQRRRPVQLAAGLVLALLGALAALWLVNDRAQRVPVLVMARAVAVGQAVADVDLAVTEVSVDPGVATVPAGRRAEVVRQVARTDLVAGAVLAPDQVAAAGPPEQGQVLVVLAIPPSRMPATGLAPGTPILVVSTPPTDADATTVGVPASIAAVVVRVGAPDLNGLTPVDVAVPAGDGPALAARAATGRIAVLVRPTGSAGAR